MPEWSFHSKLQQRITVTIHYIIFLNTLSYYFDLSGLRLGYAG